MSYREHLKAQKKYIQTKIEARQAKEERIRNPRPQRLDPPPVPTSPWVIVLLSGFILLPVFVFAFFLYSNALVAGAQTTPLTVWISGSESEFELIKNWLEPEILANDLEWQLKHGHSQQDLMHSLATAREADLLLIEEELAQELFFNQALVPLREKQIADWTNTFRPMWEAEPFQKSLGWAIPANARVSEARHLFTMIQHFIEPFKP